MLTNEYNTALSLIRNGKAPGNTAVINEISVGIDKLADFWREKYLEEYINLGGSRIQFLTGRTGSGKTHFIEYFLGQAEGYKIVSFSAKKVWLHDFKEIFTEIFRQCDLSDCLKNIGDKIIKEMGFDPFEIPETGTFVDFLSDNGLCDPIAKREIRQLLSETFLKNPLIDNNFALACSLLTGAYLGHPTLEDFSREALLGWLEGKKDVSLASLRKLGLSPSRITKHNARHMLRSLTEIVVMAGYSGIIVAVDDLDILVSRDSLEDIRYTKLKREDAYESIRELIDEIDTLKNIMFFFAFDRKLMDDDAGLKSYQALWFRIQNEIKSDTPNLFANIIDLDRLQLYDTESVVFMSDKIAKLLGTSDIIPISTEAAQELITHARFGSISLPRQVVMATVWRNAGGEHND